MTTVFAACTTYEGLSDALSDLILDLPQHSSTASFGNDIDAANSVLLSHGVPEDDKRQVLRSWIGRWQPCLFGRLAAHRSRNLDFDLCWVHEWELDRGREYVMAKIQVARRKWKDRAEVGLSSGFLIMFNSRSLAHASPSDDLVRVCCEFANLYLVEHAPIVPDVIYTEAVPLRRSDGVLTLFKAGCNIFYGSAHLTRNHDRRVPGGLLFSMNSPGHYANSLVLRGAAESLHDAVSVVQETAFRSVGNGGIGAESARTTSWHNRCPDRMGPWPSSKKRPSYIPSDFDGARYSAMYHTDVLVPTEVTVDNRTLEGVAAMVDPWSHLIIDYITEIELTSDHVNYGLFHGHPIEDCGKYHNPWQPRVAHNTELFVY